MVAAGMATVLLTSGRGGCLNAVRGGERGGSRKVRRALVSVFDKTGLLEFASALNDMGVELLSTGGTYRALRDAGLAVEEVSAFTGAPEVFDGRVKTLHPKIHGGLLYVRGNEEHERQAISAGIRPIDLVVVNLYPFEEALRCPAKSRDEFFSKCIENIDIGGPAMIRSAAKNNAFVAVVSSPRQYGDVLGALRKADGETSADLRLRLAAEAFRTTAAYDSMIFDYLETTATTEVGLPPQEGSGDGLSAKNSSSTGGQRNVEATTVLSAAAEGQGGGAGSASSTKPPLKAEETLAAAFPRVAAPVLPLKYGLNPHQAPAALCAVNGRPLPFRVINGSPGYVNLLDAAFAWQLVTELRSVTGMCAAASFKHCSPAGAAVAVPLDEDDRKVFEVGEGAELLSAAATAYIRARNGDPLCSFGDFAAISDEVDEAAAKILKIEVSDGIVAKSFTSEALAILQTKKNGSFVILESTGDVFKPPDFEFREVFGMGLLQRRNDRPFDSSLLQRVVTTRSDLPEAARRDLLLASICVRFTQSNSVGYAVGGQMVGVGAGQQSRIDCVKLAGRKTAMWHLRRHPKVLALRFAQGVKRQERINARVQYIEGDFTESEKAAFDKLFEEPPEMLTPEERDAFVASSVSKVALSSDAFFPFRDNVDRAAKYGVEFIAQPGGSVQDDVVTAAANEHGMFMAHTATRLFLH